jgi:hypothetical protein
VSDVKACLVRKAKDYDVQVEMIRAAARKWAREHDLEVATTGRVHREDDRREKTGIYLQFDRSGQARHDRQQGAMPLAQAQTVKSERLL